MFRPWKPVDHRLRTYPSLSWKIENLSVTIHWEEWRNQVCEFRMKIHFADGLVGHLAADESIHFAAPFFPSEEVLIHDSETELPWPAWVSDKNFRLPLYTDYAASIYNSLVSYYFHGSETVLLLDINDAEPEIEITTKAGNRMESNG
jgi:hypothetical protein